MLFVKHVTSCDAQATSTVVILGLDPHTTRQHWILNLTSYLSESIWELGLRWYVVNTAAPGQKHEDPPRQVTLFKALGCTKCASLQTTGQNCYPPGNLNGASLLCLLLFLPLLQITGCPWVKLLLVLRGRLHHDLQHVLVVEEVLFAHALRRVLCTRPPHHRILELRRKIFVQPIAQVLHCVPPLHDERLAKIWGLTLLLRVDSHQIKLLPNCFDHLVQVEIPLAADDDGVRGPGKPVHLLQRNRVHLVVDIQARQVLAVAFHNIDEVVHRRILSYEDLGVMDLVSVQNVTAQFLTEMRGLAGGGVADDVHGCGRLLLEVNVWPGFVQADPHGLHFVFQQRPLDLGLAGVNDDQNEVGGSCRGDHLLASPLSF
mmetsp:Transcript_17818/g.28220  ORF Transcript_17818/g.28220 Transcript_17818/m.28220 type:complete len:373 (-) Transcript_17818:440-1558(-)